MTLATLLKFLIGDREAILCVDDSKHAVWIGLLFVLSAGFAREYDGEDLWHEPWHLLLPLGVTIVASLVLYGVILLAIRMPVPQVGRGYVRFLALFTMTAPLAWLYAIPAERMLSAGDSVRMNLWLLAIVSAWRVLLISRVVSVVYQCRFLSAFSLVMLFADAVVLTVLYFTPLPVISIMGGIRLSEAEQVLQATAFLVAVLGVVSLPVWLIAAAVVLMSRWQRRPDEESHAVGRSVWGLGLAGLLVWIPVLPLTQPEQIRRREAERLLSEGKLTQGLAYMSQHQRSDFPPHWEPPPRLGYGETEPRLFDVVKATHEQGSAEWVRDVYQEKMFDQARASPYGIERVIDLKEMDEGDLRTYIEILERVPEGPRVAEFHADEIEQILRMADDPEYPTEITDRRRALLQSIQEIAEQESDDAP